MTYSRQPAVTTPDGEDSGRTAPPRVVSLGGDQVGQLSAALEDAFTLDQLRQLMVTGLEGNLSLSLDAVVPVAGRNLHDICRDLVLWSLRDERVGLQGLLAAALRTNPSNPLLLDLQKEWTSVTFTAPACPYPGMKPFTAAEQGRFYGRESEIQQAVERMRRLPVLAIVGPSGSGKSSLLAAGLLPALAKSHYFADKRWIVRIMRPGAAPYDTLAATLALDTDNEDAQGGIAVQLPTMAAGTRLLLVVDQFEELFTTATADQVGRFEQVLLRLIGAPDFCLIVAARADFYANLMASPLWPRIPPDHRLEVTPPRGDALREAIALPARDVGVQLEPQLVERLLADAGEEPGVLPFVQETLVRLWAHADRLVIGLNVYTDLVGDKSGRSGLQVALAEHANHVYGNVLAGKHERDIAERILLRLVQFGEGRPDTRRQQTVDELRKGSGEDGIFDKVLAALTVNRLLTLSEEARRVDLSHEALISGWPRLHWWIEQRRVAELTRRRLEEKAAERQRLRNDNLAGGLLDAVELAEADAWLKGSDAAELGVSVDLANLVVDSREAIDASRRQAARTRKVLSGLAIAAIALLLVALAAASIAYNSTQQRLADLKPEELRLSALDKKAQLDALGAVADFNAAAAAAAERGKVLDVSSEITDTLRYVATTYVQEGERILCNAFYDQPEKCEVPVTGQATTPMTTSVVISQTYLAWAQDAAPQIVGWSSLTSTVKQQAVISATALYSQALELNQPPDTPVYVWIAPGVFDMGSTDEQCAKAGIRECPYDEQPSHPVTLDGYWMQRTEVTNEQYKRCVDAGGCPDEPANQFWELPRSARLPVTYVDWNQASAYAAWVGGRLPTEAEWEKACRSADGRIYPWGDEPPATERLNYNVESGGTTEVGTYPPGANGLYDMAGNVREWTAYGYSADYYKSSLERNPDRPEEVDFRTVRGGEWNYIDFVVRCADREVVVPVIRDNVVGFRVLSPGF